MSWPRMQSREMKTLSFTVHASRDQAERWEAAASVQGRMSVGTWLGETADAYLRELAKAGRPAPLAWFRDRFPVFITDDAVTPAVHQEVQVRGVVSGPFGIFRGNVRGITGAGSFQHSLVHLHTRRVIATLAYQRACKALAAELTVLSIDWQEKDPEKVLLAAPDKEKAQSLLRLFAKLTTK